MKIRIRITLLFTFLAATILLIFAVIIYLSASENRENEFFDLLQMEAITKANLYFEAQVDEETLQEIYRSNRKIINEVEVAIYTPQFELLYHDASDIDFVKETAEMIDQIIERGSISFYQEKWQVVGLIHIHNDTTYALTAAAFDQSGYNKLNSLRDTLIVVFITSIFVIFLIGLLFTKKAFNPIKEMARDAKKISALNLDYRLAYKDNNDEIAELSSTFNEMMDRLETSFNAQKHFVSNISHELRTPLSAMIAELEIATSKERTKEELTKTINYALSDAQKIGKLTSSLLDFAKASYDTSEITFSKIRVDEIILDAAHQVQKSNPDYKIDLQFDKETEKLQTEDFLFINGNEYLLKIAFVNLIENGCKFSENKLSRVSIKVSNGNLIISFTDTGIGIPKKDLNNIFTPFYRGKNKNFAEGNGIGLSLVKKIIQLHQGKITVSSKEKDGSVFKTYFPKL